MQPSSGLLSGQLRADAAGELEADEPPVFTLTWRKGSARRAALERVNVRIDDGFCFERHTIRGKDKMRTRVALTLSVMIALALNSIRAKAHDRMRSLVRPQPVQAA